MQRNLPLMIQFRRFNSKPCAHWFYHDCADVLVLPGNVTTLVAAAALLPPELLPPLYALTGPCSGSTGGFTVRTFPPTLYAGLFPATLGTIALAIIAAACANLSCLMRAARRQRQAPLQASPSPLPGASAPPADQAADEAGQKSAPPGLCAHVCAVARQRWRLLALQAAIGAAALVVTGAVVSTLPTCRFRPSPVFGP